MKKQLTSLGMLSLIALAPLCSEEKKEAQQGLEIAKISEAFGHLIGKNLENIGVKFDIAQVIKGLQDEFSGKDSPMSEMECVQAIASVQERVFKEQSEQNLQKAETFLAENTKKEGVVSLEEGKVQYHIDTTGKGSDVELHHSPLIRYTGKYLDGTVFSASKEEESLSLDEVIPGLRAGLLGMKEGEKRTIFIHPELAYGTSGYLPPNSLLTFEIEIVKANAPQKESNETTAVKPSAEIVDGGTAIR
ncbi:MAG: FKBP-type peptidyl-prolyl cis-trans isomerase N-terminal domain-containing protein [Chlamydiota bacterium]